MFRAVDGLSDERRIEVPTVAELAAEKEISEYDVFAEAFRWYFGGAHVNGTVDVCFKRYLSDSALVPGFVQRYLASEAALTFGRLTA